MSDSGQPFAPFMIRCTRCEHRIKIKRSELVGRRVACPECKMPVRVGQPDPDSPSSLPNLPKLERPAVKSVAATAADGISSPWDEHAPKPAFSEAGRANHLVLPLALGGLGVCAGLLIAVLFFMLTRENSPTQVANNAPASLSPELPRLMTASKSEPIDATKAKPSPTQPVTKPSEPTVPNTATSNQTGPPPSFFPPGAFPPGAGPPWTTPPGAYPPGAFPPGAFPPGMVPPGMRQRNAPQNPAVASNNGANPTAAPAPPNDGATLAKGGTREIIDRVGNGIVLINSFDASGQKESLGSGFIIDPSGRVVTNYHVIEHAAKATAQFKDGSECEIEGYFLADKEHDLAVLQLHNPRQPLTVLQLAHNAEPQQGDDVVAIGHPQGYAFTVTTGIVSAVRTYDDIPEGIRELAELAEDGRWIQTTAPITRGNSGGPLLNAKGEVIGVNTWIMADAQNMAFACHVRVIDESLTHQTSTAKSFPVPGAKAPVNSLVGKVLEGFAEDYVTYAQRIRSAGSEAERGRLATQSPVLVYMQKLYELADKHRKEKIALEALASACELSTLDKPRAGKSLKMVEARLLEDHVDDEKLGDVALLMLKANPEDAKDFLNKLSTKSPHREVKGFATFTLVVHQVDALSGANKAEENKVISLLKKLASQYGDVTVGENKLGDFAEPLIFEVEHLRVGKKAPDMKGKDFDGKSLKLSEYRGSVVVLDFSSDIPSVEEHLYPHNQMVVQRYKSDSFQLLGVNLDPIEKGRTAVDLKKITWPCISDGPKGPISKRWNIKSVPRNFVIDEKGVIRYRDLYGSDLIQAIEGLLTEMNPNRPPYHAPAPAPVVIAPNAPNGPGLPSGRSRMGHLGPGPRMTPHSRIPRYSPGRH